MVNMIFLILYTCTNFSISVEMVPKKSIWEKLADRRRLTREATKGINKPAQRHPRVEKIRKTETWVLEQPNFEATN